MTVTYRVRHLDNLEPAIDLRHEVRRARKCNGAGTNKAPVECRVLPDAFSEGASLYDTMRSLYQGNLADQN